MDGATSCSWVFVCEGATGCADKLVRLLCYVAWRDSFARGVALVVARCRPVVCHGQEKKMREEDIGSEVKGSVFGIEPAR